MSVTAIIISVAFASAFGSIVGLVVCALIWKQFEKPEETDRIESVWEYHGDRPKPWHAEYPDGCVSCGTKDRPHKAKGMDKRCYEREGARKRYRKAKSSSKR